MNNFKLTKKERLCSTSLIGQLFDQGSSFYTFPLKVVYLKTTLPSHHPVQVSFSVSKKNFKRAVHRNLIKRRMREAYRLNKPAFYARIPEGEQLAMMIIYSCKEEKDFKQIEKGMKKVLDKLAESWK
ncbi:ribonuclease P protein component [Sunxiuqinia elliptica]|uniref:Ribonuclease P protein component n=1 Tax=Sunxiuqinia elliptica TaxID=655355 RepID=A0A4R6H1U5_9BACT|nr:ribonuclease P protein component [Sunxiuqinia elliptica]TDO01341.1 ribonuclease P protein component [Sunxiuqinia elliptica]TDO57852.1 ribonuclease P protein component [Sunxiuqinia elliptica]